MIVCKVLKDEGGKRKNKEQRNVKQLEPTRLEKILRFHSPARQGDLRREIMSIKISSM